MYHSAGLAISSKDAGQTSKTMDQGLIEALVCGAEDSRDLGSVTLSGREARER